VLLAPGVFPVSKAMFTGETPAGELAEGHTAMLDEIEKDHGLPALADHGEAHHG